MAESKLYTWSFNQGKIDIYKYEDEPSVTFGSKGVVKSTDSSTSWQIKYTIYLSTGDGSWSNDSSIYTNSGSSGGTISGPTNGKNVVSRTINEQALYVGIRIYKRESSSDSWELKIEHYEYNQIVSPLRKYTITFSANGGTGAPDPRLKYYGETVLIPPDTPTRDGYVFNSWNTLSNGSGTSYVGGDTYSTDANMTLYAIWNPRISFNANSGVNPPASFVKTFNQSATLPSGTPTKDGFVFVSWNTNPSGNGTAYQPSGSVAASMNTAMTLYAIYRKTTAAPTISSITAFRCNSSGTANDMGTYVKVTAAWRVDTTNDTYNSGTVTGRYMVSGSSSSTSFTPSGASGQSGTATAILSGFDTDTQYEFVIRVQDTNQDAGHTNVTERSVILTRAKFIMDLKAGGEAMGLFSAAPQEGLEVGKDTQIDGDLTVLGKIVAPILELSSENGTSVASSTGNFTLSSAYGYKYGPLRMFSATFYADASLTVGSSYTLGSLTSDYSLPRAMGFANQYGVGYVSGTTIYFKPLVSVSTSNSLYVALTYIKP